MSILRTAIAAGFGAILAGLPLSAAKAQYYCNPFPLFWPVCAAGAVVGTAAAVATAPLRAIAPPYYGYYGYYGPAYYAPAYYPYYGYYGPHWRRHHRRHW